MNELENILKRDDIGAVLSCGKVRLYFDDTTNEWVVKDGRKIKYRGPFLKSATGWFNAMFEELAQ